MTAANDTAGRWHRRGGSLRSAANAGGVLWLILLASFAMAAQSLAISAEAVAAAAAAPPKSQNAPGGPAKISYADGQLRIEALDSTLGEVLTKVAALTGVKIELPPGANSEPMPVFELGPGPTRQVLASLLSAAHLDYLIQASDSDPEKIQSVLLLPREKKPSGTNATEVAARTSHSPYARAAAAAREESPPDNPATAPAENASADEASLNPQPPPQPDLPAASASTQPDAPA